MSALEFVLLLLSDCFASDFPVRRWTCAGVSTRNSQEPRNESQTGSKYLGSLDAIIAIVSAEARVHRRAARNFVERNVKAARDVGVRDNDERLLVWRRQDDLLVGAHVELRDGLHYVTELERGAPLFARLVEDETSEQREHVTVPRLGEDARPVKNGVELEEESHRAATSVLCAQQALQRVGVVVAEGVDESER